MHSHPNDDGMGNLQSMGILNALRTGDPSLDMILAVLLPVILKFLWEIFHKVQQQIQQQNRDEPLWTVILRWLYSPHTTTYERIISHESTRDAYGYVNGDGDEDVRNKVLIKAIQLYLHKVAHINLRKGHVDLTSLLEGRQRNCYDSDDEDSDSEEDTKTFVGALSQYEIVERPCPHQWYTLDYKFEDTTSDVSETKSEAIHFLIETHEEDRGQDHRSHTRIMQKISLRADSVDVVNSFVRTAYNWYKDELRQLEDHARYLYEHRTIATKSDSEEAAEAAADKVLYTRYRLSDQKTFASLFFPQKESLLRLLNHFSKREGKYAVPGYPHKLGLLLHGPPGSGKTSLIKALAQHLGRSIINVPLAKISTNSQLQSIFFDRRKNVAGSQVPVQLGFKDVIFVMEDVDAASKIVKRRENGSRRLSILPAEEEESAPLPCPKPLWHLLVESTDSCCKELVETLVAKSEDLRNEAKTAQLLVNVVHSTEAIQTLATMNTPTASACQQQMSDKVHTAAQKLAERRGTIQEEVERAASSLLNLVKLGGTVDEQFVDALMGRGGYAAYSVSSSATNTTVRMAVSSDESWDPANRPGEAGHLVSSNEFLLLEKHLTNLQNSPTGEAGKGSPFVSNNDGAAISAAAGIGPSPFPGWSRHGKDQLNLTGLLNVLDGVVDCPNRIVIMTTNHVDHLDPALIRPGRIDKKLHLGHMDTEDVSAMLEHYFQTTLTGHQRDRVSSIFARRKVTPAQVEQLTAEHDDIDEMLSSVEDGLTMSLDDSYI